MKNKSFTRSVKNAVMGFLRALRSERNLRIDIVIAILVMIFAYAYGLEPIGWGVLILTICAVITAELFNTAIENATDAITEEYNEHIGFAKDISAAAVAVTAAGALLVGILLFLTNFDKLIIAILDIVYSKKALTAILVTFAVGIPFILQFKERKK